GGGCESATFRLPAIVFQEGCEGTAAAQPAPQLVAQPPRPTLRLVSISLQQRLVLLELLGRDRRVLLTETDRPDVGGALAWPVPAQDPAGVLFQEHLQRLRREPPVVARVVVNVEVERARHQQYAVRAQHSVNLVE